MTDKTPVKKPAPAKGVPALMISTARGISKFRRAGFGFAETPTVIPLADLKEHQIKALRNDPALIVKEVVQGVDKTTEATTAKEEEQAAGGGD